MAETDLSKIVGLIMDNPELVMKIKELANKDEKDDKTDVSTEETPLMSTSIPTSSESDLLPKKTRRTALLHALKPYLSEKRGRAIESMITVLDVIMTVNGD